MKTTKPLKMAIRQQKNRAPTEPHLPSGALYARMLSGMFWARRASTKKMWETRMDIQVRRPNMVTKLTKYPKTVAELVETFMNARRQKQQERPKAKTGTPRASVRLKIRGALPSTASP